MESKYIETLNAYHVTRDDDVVAKAVADIITKHRDENRRPEILKYLFSCIDLTTLNSTDSQQSVANFTERVNSFAHEHQDLPNVAAICVYPNFVPVVRTVLECSDVDIASVAGGFPTAQTFIEVKIAEVGLAVEAGANEIDVVLGLGDFFDRDYQEVCDQLDEMKHSCRAARMKVILETGALKTAENIRNASILALYSGADFLKTSTGKEHPGASLEAAWIMCQCIKEYYEKTSRMVGFKCSGGVSTTEDALAYYTIVKEVLGDKWLETNEFFRIGASRLANNLLSDILGEPTKFF